MTRREPFWPPRRRPGSSLGLRRGWAPACAGEGSDFARMTFKGRSRDRGNLDLSPLRHPGGAGTRGRSDRRRRSDHGGGARQRRHDCVFGLGADLQADVSGSGLALDRFGLGDRRAWVDRDQRVRPGMTDRERAPGRRRGFDVDHLRQRRLCDRRFRRHPRQDLAAVGNSGGIVSDRPEHGGEAVARRDVGRRQAGRGRSGGDRRGKGDRKRQDTRTHD